MNPLQQRLTLLRQRLRSVVLTRGLSLVLLTSVGAALLAGLLDWEVHLPPAVRAALLTAALAATAAVAYAFLLAPLRARADDLALALRIENEYPVLNDALASTVQFLRQPDESPEGGSPALRREAVQRALRLAQGCDFNRVVDARGLWLSGTSAAVAAGIAVLLCLWQPALVRSATLRLLHPFGEHDWATRTRLELQFAKRVEAGRRFQIRGQVSGVIPKSVVLHLKRYTGGDNAPREYLITPREDGKTGEFVIKLDLVEQHDSFEFFVQANDARSPRRTGRWHTVTVAQPPRLVAVDGVPSPQKVELAFPSYTDLPSPRLLPPGTKLFEAVAGTWVTLEARADVPLSRAWIAYEAADEDAPAKFNLVAAARLGAVGMSSPLGLLAAVNGSEQAWAQVPVELDAARTGLRVHFRPWVSGKYILHIEDDTGLANDEKFDIQLFQDPAPVVVLEQPSSNRAVLAKADVSLEITARDEKFGLKSVFLEYWRKDKHGRVTSPVRRLNFFDPELATKGQTQGVTDALGIPLDVEPSEGTFKPPLLVVKKRWSLAGLVKEGDTLVIRAGAADFNDVAAYNTPGYSQEVELRVVGKTEMNLSLDDAQAKVQDKLVRLKELQQGARDNVHDVDKKWADGKPVGDEELKKLLDKIQDAAQWQQEMRDLIGKDKKEGLLPELKQLEQIIKDNKIDSSEAKDRAKLLQGELKKIDKGVEAIQPHLNRLKQQLEALSGAKKPNPDGGKKDLADTQAQQQKVLDAVNELLQQMDPWARLHKLRAEAQALLEGQKKVQATTEKLNDTFAPKDKAWVASLSQAAEQQQQLASDAQRLLDKLKKGTDEEKDKNADMAKMFDEALQLGLEANLAGNMKTAEERLRAQRLNEAMRDHEGGVAALKDIIDALTEKRENQLEKLIQQQQNAKGGLTDLVERLEKLEKQIADAKKLTDPAEKKQALDKLAMEEQKLLNEMREKARELARLRADDAAQDLNNAAKQLEQGLKKLQEGGDPLDDPQQALDQLKKAEKDLQQAQKQIEEELAREKLTKIADQLMALKERQDGLITESERLHKVVLQAGWTGKIQGQWWNHMKAQVTLSREAQSLSEKLKGAKVFEMILQKSAGSMNDAAGKIEERLRTSRDRRDVFPFDPDALKDEQQQQATIVQLQQQAGQRLQSLLDAVKEAQQKQEAKADDPEKGKEPEGQQPMGGVPAQDGIPGIAQLKALKSEQVQINDRTRAFAKQHPDMANLSPEARAELESIRADQEAIFELFQEITAGINQGEKK